MNEDLQSTVLEALDLLLKLQQEAVQPTEARVKLRAFRVRHPHLHIDLLSEVEAFDESIHYDLLLRRTGEGTLSLSYCAERAVPWPMRGVHRWSEADLVRVNAQVLQVDQAIACLDFIWDDAPIIQQLVNQCIIREEVERQQIALSDDELQKAMDEFRTKKKLFKAEDTLQWLEQHGMCQEKLEQYVADHAIVAKLRDQVSGHRVEAYFDEHSAEFDIARIAQFAVSDEQRAGEMSQRICDGSLSFDAAAELSFMEAADRGICSSLPAFGLMERREVAKEFRESLFSAGPGAVIGPIPVDSHFCLLRVVAIVPARLDVRTHATIKSLLFEQWLAERRDASRIDWCWGNASQTAR